jgi:hypothetical protein
MCLFGLQTFLGLAGSGTLATTHHGLGFDTQHTATPFAGSLGELRKTK